MVITAPQVIGWITAGVAAYLGVYLAEKAKRRAAHEDSDHIRAELARNTRAVKEIEAKFNSDLWDRQWRMNQRRDIYARLIEGMGELQMTLDARAGFLKANDPEGASELGDRTKALMLELERSRAVARIFLSSESVEVIDDFERGLKKQPEGFDFEKISGVFTCALEKLTSAARIELGFASNKHPANHL